MFWIHGGANITGSAGQTDASRLTLEHDVVVVMPNYRLGPLGWFSHPALRSGTEPQGAADAGTPLEAGNTGQPAPADPLRTLDHSGNYGTLDLVQALRWVQENVASFGGDPGKVTIFGVSAGGANVLSLLLSPLAKGLFHGAISESGVIYSHAMTEAEADADHGGHGSSSTEVLLRLLVADGRAKDREGAKAVALTMDAAETARYLRAQPGKALLRATLRPRPTGDDRPPEFPTVLRDGTVMPEGPALEQFASGHYHRVPTILGTNRDEMKLFMVVNPELVKTRVPPMIEPLDPELYALLAEYRSDAWRAGTVHVLAPAMRKVQGASVFGYRFDWDEQPRVLLTDLSLLVGAGHGLEVPFVFGTFDAGGRSRFMFTEDNREGREALSSAMRSYWAELAHTGRPGAGRTRNLRPWKPWSDAADGEKFLVLDTQEGGGLRMERTAPTVTELLARLKSDPRLPETRDKCRVLYWLTHRGRSVERKRYFDLQGLDCKAFPPERYPWPAP
jgi:para-nitrobenzyl esterase